MLRLAYTIYALIDAWLARLLWDSNRSMAWVFGAYGLLFAVALLGTLVMSAADFGPRLLKCLRVILFVNAVSTLPPLAFYAPAALRVMLPFHLVVLTLGLAGVLVLNREVRALRAARQTAA